MWHDSVTIIISFSFRRVPLMVIASVKLNRHFDRRVNVINSATRLGDFWNLLLTKFLTKVAQLFVIFLSDFWKTSLRRKNCCGHFLGNFLNKMGTFYFNIWSHFFKTFFGRHLKNPDFLLNWMNSNRPFGNFQFYSIFVLVIFRRLCRSRQRYELYSINSFVTLTSETVF